MIGREYLPIPPRGSSLGRVSKLSVQDGTRWVFDPDDSFGHVVAGSTPAELGMLVTRCGKQFCIERTATFSVPPSLAVCPVCRPRQSSERPAGLFPTPTHF